MMNTQSLHTLKYPVMIGICYMFISCGIFKRTSTPMMYSEYKNMYTLDKLYDPTDTIKLLFSHQGNYELAIRTPSGEFFYMVYNPAIPTIPQGKPVVSYKEFSTTRQLNIPISTFKANPHDTKYKGNQLVFKKSGTYTLMLGKNLSTDDGTPVEQLQIKVDLNVKTRA
jgi:hypothetical protein